MRTSLIALIVSSTLLGACARPSPEQQIVNDAATALGGRDRVLAATTLVIEGSGENGNLGQDMTPEARTQTFTVSGYKRSVDFTNLRARVEQTRTPNFVYFQGPQPQTQVTGVDGQVAYNMGANGAATRGPDAAAADRRTEIYHHPIGIVRAALDPAAKLTNPHTAGDERVVDVTTTGGQTFTLAIGATGLPTRVVSMADNTNLGDVAVETRFADYKDVDGLKLPSRLTTTTDGVMMADIRVSAQHVNGTAGDLAAPAAAASAPPPTAPPPTVTVENVAKGVWWLAGQSHHSAVVEFADHLTLIEAPLNDARALAVIAKARELNPAKPLTTVVMTHHHFDHEGGIRAAISEGLTVVAQKGTAAFLQSAATRPHTIVPDALAKTQKPLKLETVDEETVLKDGATTMNLYRIAGSPHADTLLMAYLPASRTLIEADVFTPGSPVNMFSANLLDNIKRLGIRVDRIVPIHGTLATYADLLKTQAPPPAK
jgi:glyoxylase-like metal-dependent hydrolase (beta-lactamase superfamily II)